MHKVAAKLTETHWRSKPTLATLLFNWNAIVLIWRQHELTSKAMSEFRMVNGIAIERSRGVRGGLRPLGRDKDRGWSVGRFEFLARDAKWWTSWTFLKYCNLSELYLTHNNSKTRNTHYVPWQQPFDQQFCIPFDQQWPNFKPRSENRRQSRHQSRRAKRFCIPRDVWSQGPDRGFWEGNRWLEK